VELKGDFMSNDLLEIGGAPEAPAEGDALSGADSFNAHIDYDPDSQEQSTETETETEEKSEPIEKEQPEEKQVEETPQQKFLKEQKLDLEEFKDNEAVQSLINKAFEAQNALTETQRTQQMEKDALEKKRAEAEAQKVIDSESEPEEKPLSPLEIVDSQFQATSEALSKILGVENLDALRGQQIDGDAIWALMQSEYDKEYRQANIQQAQWVKDQDSLKASNEAAAAKLETEFKNIQASVVDKFTNVKKDFPDIEDVFKDMEQDKYLDDLSNATNTPIEYLMNYQPVFDFCVNAAKNHKIVQGLGERDAKIKGDHEKNISKLKKAEMVSKSEPLPDDHGIETMFKLSDGKGVDILK
jgi:hypothetical protein